MHHPRTKGMSSKDGLIVLICTNADGSLKVAVAIMGFQRTLYYGARSSISMLEVPTVGTHSWKRIQEETVTLVDTMTLKESLQIRNNRLTTPVTVSGIHSHSKTSKCMIMYNLPLSRGTMTRTLTLQVSKKPTA